ncbi:MAG TPA: Gfo/Idh/MocA family oxidoreductase [Candidatus Dojkabacteria bacterium]|jgi:predicted dehydrogenase
MKIGIIGCGKQANIHFQGIKELGLFELGALCDIDKISLESFFRSTGSPEHVFLTQDYKECIDRPDIDAFIISTHTNTHIEIAEYALSRKKHILIEKPIGLAKNEIDGFIEKAIESDVVVYPGLHYRNAYFYNNMKNYVDSELLRGSKYLVMSEHRNPFFLPWFYDKSKSGGAVNDKVIHYFDIASGIFEGKKPKKVYAIGSQHIYKNGETIYGMLGEKYVLENPNVVDNAAIIVQYEDDSIATINLNMYQKAPIEGLQIYIGGLNGNFVRFINLDTPNYSFLTQDDEYEISQYRILDKTDTDDLGIGHPGSKEIIKDFYYSIIGERKQRVNLWDARVGQMIALASEAAIESGEPEDMKRYENLELEEKAKKKGWLDKRYYEEYDVETIDKLDAGPKRFVIINNLIKRIRGKRNAKLTRRRMGKIIIRLREKYDLEKYLDGVRIKLSIIFPWDEIHLSFYDGDITMVPHFEESDGIHTITITNRGFFGMLDDVSLNYLYMTRAITLEGQLNELRYLRSFLDIFIEEIKRECVVRSS